MWDDLLGTFSAPEITGKPALDDIRRANTPHCWHWHGGTPLRPSAAL